MHGVALSQKCPALFTKESIMKTKSGFACEGKGGFNVDDIIITRRIVVTTVAENNLFPPKIDSYCPPS